jgi:ABC-type amino acid transport substrate-binding protein
MRFLLLSALCGTVLHAQSAATEQWRVSFTDNSYRYENGVRVPTGRQTVDLSVAALRGDSVVAVLGTLNPEIADTLVGVRTPDGLRLASRPRAIIAQRPETGERRSPEMRVQLELRVRDDRADGTMVRELTGLPGRVAPERLAVTAERVP